MLLQGVRGRLEYSKRDLLLFTRLNVMGVERQLSSTTYEPHVMADFEYLLEAGYMVDAPDTSAEFARFGKEQLLHHFGEEALRKDYESWLFDDAYVPGTIDHVTRIVNSGHHPAGVGGPLPRVAECVLGFVMTATGNPCAPVLSHRPTRPEWDALRGHLFVPVSFFAPDPEAAVVELVVRNLPIPGDDVPLDSILEFTSDADTREKRLFGFQQGVMVASRSQSGRPA